MPHQFIEDLGERFYMVINTYILLLIMQQYVVPALKDRMKYNRNYDGSKRSASKVEEVTKQDDQPPPKKAKVFKPKDCPKPPAVPILPLGEDQASFMQHLKFLQSEERKVHPNQQVVTFSFGCEYGC